jgi:predicted RNA-binding protein with PIN domain
MSVYIIDGYNLMHELLGHPVSRNAGDEGVHGFIPFLEDERRRLVDRIASYMGGTADRAIVVFDSKTQELQKTERATANVTLHFGSFDRSADSIIEREVFALDAGEKVVVVTSDYGLQKVVFRPNVVRQSSREFLRDLQEHTKKIANHKTCITIGNRVEERIPSRTLDKLKALREELDTPPD